MDFGKKKNKKFYINIKMNLNSKATVYEWMLSLVALIWI